MGINKTPKGEICIEDYRGRIRLRWRYAGERYSLNLPYAYLPEYMHHATIKVAEIKLDMLKGCFDATLGKYKPITASAPVVTPQPVIHEVKEEAFKNAATGMLLKELVPKFNTWATAIRNVDVENVTYYLYTRNLLERWGEFNIDDIPVKLSKANYAVTSYNDRLSCLNNFFAWLLKKGHLSYNPLEDVRRRRKKRKSNSKRMPLEEQEILAFLQAIKNDTYCHKSSGYKHSYYYPFLAFIFYTGVRNAEAIGLRVRHVHLSDKQVEISESFARTVKGSHHAARIQKETKTDNVRYLPLTDELITLLEKQIAGKQPDDFVFPSPTGLCIDDRMLKRRVIKPVLKELGFGDRDLYAARHSFGTRAVQQGMSLTDVAYLMGHTTIETASRNYVHVGKPAVALPGLNNKQVPDNNTNGN
jgi:integrase